MELLNRCHEASPCITTYFKTNPQKYFLTMAYKTTGPLIFSFYSNGRTTYTEKN